MAAHRAAVTGGAVAAPKLKQVRAPNYVSLRAVDKALTQSTGVGLARFVAAQPLHARRPAERRFLVDIAACPALAGHEP